MYIVLVKENRIKFIMSLNFCPNCSNLLTYTHTPDRQLIMKCHSCNYPVNDISDVCVYYNKFVQNSYDIKIDPDQSYDNTLPYTDEIDCLNTACPTYGYDIFVKAQMVSLTDELGEEEAKNEFTKRGGIHGDWILGAWGALNNEEKAKYKEEAGLRNKVKYFHYNKDMKLAYVCCYCNTSWKN